MQTGIIYLIINLHNLQNNLFPFLYIGSKLNINRFDGYWGSCKSLTSDVARLGEHNFKKVILKPIEYENPADVTLEESRYHKSFSVKSSPIFYNQVEASGPFHLESGEHTKGTLWINNGDKNKRVKKSQLEFYLKRGYSLGRLVGNFNKGRVYIHKNGRSKSVPLQEVSTYISSGWHQGKHSGNQSGRKWVHKGTVRKLIPNSHINEYLKDGWVFGWKV